MPYEPERRGKREARLEHPRLAALQVERQDVRRVGEEVRAEIFALGIAGDLAEIGLQLLLAGAPREVRIGLAKAELRQRLHQLRPREGFRQEDRVGKLA